MTRNAEAEEESLMGDGTDRDEDELTRMEALKIAAGLDSDTPKTVAWVTENAELLLSWVNSGDRSTDVPGYVWEAPGRYVAEHVLDAERRTGTTNAHRVVGESDG